MVITSNHVPAMREALQDRQRSVNAGGTRNRYFLLLTSNSAFARKAFKKLVDKGEVEILPGKDGNVLARFSEPVPDKTVGERIQEEKAAWGKNNNQ
jgi:hypothetical protein